MRYINLRLTYLKRPRDVCQQLASISTIPRAQFFLLLVTSASDLPAHTCIQFDSVLLSSAYRRALLSYGRP